MNEAFQAGFCDELEKLAKRKKSTGHPSALTSAHRGAAVGAGAGMNEKFIRSFFAGFSKVARISAGLRAVEGTKPPLIGKKTDLMKRILLEGQAKNVRDLAQARRESLRAGRKAAVLKAKGKPYEPTVVEGKVGKGKVRDVLSVARSFSGGTVSGDKTPFHRTWKKGTVAEQVKRIGSSESTADRLARYRAEDRTA